MNGIYILYIPFLCRYRAGVVRRVESLRGRMSEAGLAVGGSQVEGLFESLQSQSFGGGA